MVVALFPGHCLYLRYFLKGDLVVCSACVARLGKCLAMQDYVICMCGIKHQVERNY